MRPKLRGIKAGELDRFVQGGRESCLGRRIDRLLAQELEAALNQITEIRRLRLDTRSYPKRELSIFRGLCNGNEITVELGKNLAYRDVGGIWRHSASLSSTD